MGNIHHPELRALRIRLTQIHDAISTFKPLTARPPILDSSLESRPNDNEESHWLRPENVPGLRKLKENIKIDLGVLEKFLDDPSCANLPPLSTNAPYLIATWNEVVCAPSPIVSVFRTFSSSSVAEKTRTTAKVDVVADNGRQWIRVNTVKNARMLSEFREIDSYLTDSDEDDFGQPSLAQTEFDNSILQMGRSLLKAASLNPVEGTTEIPKVTMRLTRLDPDNVDADGSQPDPRIRKTIDNLRELGIQVELGECHEDEVSRLLANHSAFDDSELSFVPTSNINLDLSVLIAIISDLSHAPLPQSIQEANRRFVPPLEYREWKQKHLATNGKALRGSLDPSQTEADINDLPRDLIKHSRALTNQLLQEMDRGLLQEIHDRTDSALFWTTPEARERCLRIVSKIGGIHEKRRASALFCQGLNGEPISLEEAERQYWQDSRFPTKFIALLPIRIFESSSPSIEAYASLPVTPITQSHFSLALQKVSSYILAQESVPHPRALAGEMLSENPEDELQRATVTRLNPRLTTHTVQSMRLGAKLGWTTLTANKTSVKAMLRELKAARISGRLAGVDMGVNMGVNGMEIPQVHTAAIWIVDPRSLAEGVSSMPTAATLCTS